MYLQENIQPAEGEDFAVKDGSGPGLGEAFAAGAAEAMASLARAAAARALRARGQARASKSGLLCEATDGGERPSPCPREQAAA